MDVVNLSLFVVMLGCTLFVRYSLSKYVAVLMITFGISMATIESANQIVSSS